ncbi:SUMF1/EgtB/PvdO family nonheme iron enzyme [Candidatus Symbiobacter mobilis]|uniref:Caspase-domain protein n=1 Tax=Candidatus Symbiobacter mobilis CR TaxID=946483 RepID=U5N7Z3_9BURK|nr:SUMF1/EgtB/PvdO family nonheme iron enzyme [Candidatus Symbiobacter mobilis]AGX86373.1 caspase-domain protein [Candidatus Symbiobacter mobilis CR]
MKKTLWGIALWMAASLATAVPPPPTAERGGTPVSTPINMQRKVALVIGNGKYQNQPLPNPPLDAQAMTIRLHELQFETGYTLIDADRTAMLRGLTDFRERLRGAGVALVYFAGHGIQMEGQNYLIPTDNDMQQEDAVKYNAIKLQDVLDELERSGAPVKVVILDACRNNPFGRNRGGGGGLAAVSNAAQGMLIAYATSPGNVAIDGRPGENGVYTAHLLNALGQPNLTIEDVFKRTRLGVAQATRGKQIPWETTSLTGNLVLRPIGAPTGTMTAAATVSSDAVVGAARSARPGRSIKDDEFRDCERCPTMHVLPAGRVQIGSPETEPGHHLGEGPQKEVTFAKPFAIGKMEVRFQEWEMCLLDGGCTHWPQDNGWGRGNRPAIHVSWEDAQHYVNWLSKKTGYTYRLPSESEWEYAARAGTRTARPWGDDIGNGSARCRDCGASTNRPGTSEAGAFPANPWKLHDLLGNVWEWTQDCHSPDLRDIPQNGLPTTLGDCSRRTLRGGSWDTAAKGVRSASRSAYPVSRREDNIGFRVVTELE